MIRNKYFQIGIRLLLICLIGLSPLAGSPAQAAPLAAPVPQTNAVSACSLGIIEWLAGNESAARSRLEEGIRLADANSTILHRCQIFLALLYDNAMDWAKASEMYDAALDGFREEGSLQYQWIALCGLGSVYALGMDELQRGYDLLEEALTLIQASASDEWTPMGVRPVAEAVTLNNLGIVKAMQGGYGGGGAADYEDALAYLLEAQTRLSESARVNPVDDLMALLDRLIQALLWGGTVDSDKIVEEMAMIALNSVFGSIAQDMQGLVLSNIGEVYRSLGNYSQARHYFEQVLTAAQLVQRRDDVTRSDTLPELQQILDEFDRAISFLKLIGIPDEELAMLDGILRIAEALSMQSANPAGPMLATMTEVLAYNGLGLVAYQEQEDLSGALAYFQKALDRIETKLGNRQAAVALRTNIGYLYQRQGDLDQALTHYDVAMQELDSLRSVADTGLIRVGEGGVAAGIDLVGLQGGLARNAELYAYAVEAYRQQGKDDEAFFAAEQGRARLFLDLMSARQILWDEPRRALLDAIYAAYSTRESAQTMLIQARSFAPDFVPRLQEELERATQDYARQMTAVQSRYPELAVLLPGGAPVTRLVDLQERVLDDETTLVVYYTQEYGIPAPTIAWVVDKESYALVELPVDGQTLAGAIGYLRATIATKETDRAAVSELYDQLIAPLHPHIRHQRLVIVPHGALHYLPFAALWNEKEGRYLVEEYTISYAPSASTLGQPRRAENPNNRRALVMGNPHGSDVPLTAAEEEAQAVAALLGVGPLLGKEATKESFIEGATGADIIHLAAHAIYNESDPLRSHLKLAGIGSQAAHFDLTEAFALDLSQANLVVVSACETSLGQGNYGDEIVGFNRAFLTAGTPFLITTQWKIDDNASRDLMIAFYQQWQSGQTISAALRQAQRLMQATHPDPFYWAAFAIHASEIEEELAAPHQNEPTLLLPLPSSESGSRSAPDEDVRFPHWFEEALRSLWRLTH